MHTTTHTHTTTTHTHTHAHNHTQTHHAHAHTHTHGHTRTRIHTHTAVYGLSRLNHRGDYPRELLYLGVAVGICNLVQWTILSVAPLIQVCVCVCVCACVHACVCVGGEGLCDFGKIEENEKAGSHCLCSQYSATELRQLDNCHNPPCVATLHTAQVVLKWLSHTSSSRNVALITEN